MQVTHRAFFGAEAKWCVFSRCSMDGICRSLQNFKSNKKQYYLLLVKYLRCTFAPCISSSVDKIYFLFTEVIFFHPIRKLLLLNWMRGVDLIWGWSSLPFLCVPQSHQHHDSAVSHHIYKINWIYRYISLPWACPCHCRH